MASKQITQVMANIEHINFIKAPIAKVYQALTTERGLAATWTSKLVVCPKIGFINEFDFNDNYTTKMKIRELVAHEKIIWDCIASDPEWIGTTISFDLSEKEGVTAVLFRQFHWRAVTEFYRWCNYNWAFFLLSLKKYCEEGKGIPFQERKF